MFYILCDNYSRNLFVSSDRKATLKWFLKEGDARELQVFDSKWNKVHNVYRDGFDILLDPEMIVYAYPMDNERKEIKDAILEKLELDIWWVTVTDWCFIFLDKNYKFSSKQTID